MNTTCLEQHNKFTVLTFTCTGIKLADKAAMRLDVVNQTTGTEIWKNFKAFR
jgi:hypothetical protein